MSKNVWVIGPGTTLNKYTDLVSKLNKKLNLRN